MAKRTTVHHPGLGKQVRVTARQAEVMASSGWKSGPLPTRTQTATPSARKSTASGTTRS